MDKINEFVIKKLHGFKTINLKFNNNTLILVGENGAGKTTVLNLFYYMLSGQWSLMTKYRFDEVSISFGAKKYTLRYSDLDWPLHDMGKRFLHHVPPSVYKKFMFLLEHRRELPNSNELEIFCRQYDIPLNYILHEYDLFEHPSGKRSDALRQTLKEIRESVKAQLLYLPTYRRIEQELSLIFKGFDEHDFRNRNELVTARRGDDINVELIEFGMKDVDQAIKHTLADLDKFARENLNNLTFGYLGDIVEKQYDKLDLKSILAVSEQTIDNILNRIQEPILSSKNKQHVREIINDVKQNQTQTEHSKVICHYFSKLMAFQKELETKEAQIMKFCDVCNEYMEDKVFKYDISKFTFTINHKGTDDPNRELKLHHLSSGEKQIVSLFSHLYLSGGKNYFVLIDEPELSLSVPWQRKFLLNIRQANFCIGLVAVTHSPFIYENDLRKYAHGLGEFIV